MCGCRVWRCPAMACGFGLCRCGCCPREQAAPQPIVSGMWLPLGYGIRTLPHPRHGDGLGGTEPWTHLRPTGGGGLSARGEGSANRHQPTARSRTGSARVGSHRLVASAEQRKHHSAHPRTDQPSWTSRDQPNTSHTSGFGAGLTHYGSTLRTSASPTHRQAGCRCPSSS